jgi:hypothetical protein
MNQNPQQDQISRVGQTDHGAESKISPSRSARSEALQLSDQILQDIELSQLPLEKIALKASRLARLLSDFDAQEAFELEVSGYAYIPGGLPVEKFEIAEFAGRGYSQHDCKTGEEKRYVYSESIAVLEERVRIAGPALAAAVDPDVQSNQPFATIGNTFERREIRSDHSIASARLAQRRAFVHRYVSQKYYELKFSGIAEDVFARTRVRVDSTIGKFVPSAARKLAAVYENLQSENPEDWSNAVHSCRRLLKDLADAIYPAHDERPHRLVKRDDGSTTVVKLGSEHYINRLVAFVEEQSSSGRFQAIVGSHIDFFGNRLEAILKATQKGSHSEIVSREEAERYVIYTYLMAGDILSLKGDLA